MGMLRFSKYAKEFGKLSTILRYSDNYQQPSWSKESLHHINSTINTSLISHSKTDFIKESSTSYFDGSGNQMRPILLLLIARLINKIPNENQNKIAAVAEMIHTASLMHDDVIDEALMRRGKETINADVGDRDAVLIGNFVMARSMAILASTDNTTVIKTMSNIMTELINGEVKQLTNRGEIDFEIYIEKNYLKTGALLAHGVKAISELSPGNEKNIEFHKDIFEFGKNIGIAFQIVDDCLDFTVDDLTSGKPSQGADRKLRKIMKREFKDEGDILECLNIVKREDGVRKSKDLARE